MIAKRAVAAAFFFAVIAGAQQDPVSRSWNQPVEPFRIAGNVFYVGASDVTSYLITTPKGHILLDGGFPETAPMIIANIRRLGHRIEDVRFLLSSHAHYDHAGGLAALKAASGATFVSSHGDAPLHARGGKDDPQFRDLYPYTPITADRLIADGERVELGGVALTARITPGHTPGCTTWTMNADGKRVAFLCSPSVPSSYKLLDNPRYPNAIEDYRRQFAILRGLNPDVFLASHGNFFDLQDKIAARATFVDREGYRRFVDAMEARFEKKVAEERAARPARVTVLRNTTVIDGTGAPPRANVDVVIQGGTIERIVPSTTAPPEGAEVIEAAGKYVIPGLIDMHAHVPANVWNEQGQIEPQYHRPSTLEHLRLFLRYGVTTVRDPGAITADAVLIRDLVRDGKLAGPRIFTAGRILTFGSGNPEPFVTVTDEAAVREEIRWQARAGVDAIKVYASMPPELVRVAIDEGHRHGLPVIGHVQRTTWTEAARFGIDSIEHAAPWSAAYIRESDREAAPGGMFARVYWLEHLDARAIDEMVAALAEHHVAVDPTLMAMHTKFWGDDPRYTRSPDLALVPEKVRKGWATGRFTASWTPEQYAQAQKAWPLLLGLTKKMYDRGVHLVAGTDTPTPWIVPGLSLHQELQLLADAGIPPAAILRIATYNAAVTLRREHELGSIAPGMRADLVVLAKNPLESIANTRSIELVVQGGTILPAMSSRDDRLAAKTH